MTPAVAYIIWRPMVRRQGITKRERSRTRRSRIIWGSAVICEEGLRKATRKLSLLNLCAPVTSRSRGSIIRSRDVLNDSDSYIQAKRRRVPSYFLQTARRTKSGKYKKNPLESTPRRLTLLLHARAAFSGYLITMSWRVLRLLMEDTASRYGG
jgi:hypothetical protein